MMNKRGFSHVEVIVSFVLFISFLSFAFFFFNPFQEREGVDTVAKYIFDKIEANSTIDMERYSIVTKSEISLVSIPSPSGIPVAGAAAEDNMGNRLDAWAIIGIVTFENPPNNFVVLKFSEDFPQTFNNGELLLAENYTISSSEAKKIYSQKRLSLLSDSYNSDYDSVKERFNIPTRSDFGFSVIFDDGSRIDADRDKPDNVNIYSKRERIEMLEENGKVVFADLIVMVW